MLASYGDPVIAAIRGAAQDYLEDCVILANIILPDFAVVLARQRSDYGISEEFLAEFQVFDQTSNVDNTPVNNIAMERLWGMVDYRQKHLKSLGAVSRSISLSHLTQLQEGEESNFRSYKEEVMRQRDIKLAWKQSTEEKFAR